ncbi:hypothetical protein EVAR_39288_1 [Eumeta japonica]|uniref:Uncharacterized protein n=1 Tax=Eumeta variegata TaxID=151549 RepID=A0A4C1VWN5_EUMVA|nr:hypothetical protein EVAR_39288_1 [Eumeta japonica]
MEAALTYALLYFTRLRVFIAGENIAELATPLQQLDSSFKDRPIRRVHFRAIKSKRSGSQNLSSIGSRSFRTAMLFFDIDSGPYCNGRRYLVPLNVYCQRSAPLLS